MSEGVKFTECARIELEAHDPTLRLAPFPALSLMGSSVSQQFQAHPSPYNTDQHG